MSLTLPVEELCRFTVSAKISSKDGKIDLAFKPTFSKDGLVPLTISGLSVHFETVEGDGGSVLSIFTSYTPPTIQRTSQPLTCVDSGMEITATAQMQASASSLGNNAPASTVPDWLVSWSDSFLDLSSQVLPPVDGNATTHKPHTNFQPLQTDDLDLSTMDAFIMPQDSNGRRTGQLFSNNAYVSHTLGFNNTGRDDPFFCPSPSTSTSQTDLGIAENTILDDESSESSSPPPSASQDDGPHPRWRRVACLHPGCDRHFVSAHTRRIHMRTHEPKARQYFPCTMGCTEAFSRQHDRMRHEVAKHGKECKWSCKDCRRFFSFEKTLKNHKCSGQTLSRWSIPVSEPDETT